jgi:hypothetical protein
MHIDPLRIYGAWFMFIISTILDSRFLLSARNKRVLLAELVALWHAPLLRAV